MIELLEKHCDENHEGTYICEYYNNEIGDKINEIILILNELTKSQEASQEYWNRYG